MTIENELKGLEDMASFNESFIDDAVYVQGVLLTAIGMLADGYDKGSVKLWEEAQTLAVQNNDEVVDLWESIVENQKQGIKEQQH